MSDLSVEFERFLDDVAHVINLLDERIEQPLPRETWGRAEPDRATLGEIERLAEALATVAGVAGIHDVAALGSGLARASKSATLCAPGETPAPLLGARDAMAFLHWRLAGLRAKGQTAALDARARAQAATIVAALAVAAGDGVASVAGSVAGAEAGEDDDLSGLSPEDQELARSFASLDLSARPSTLKTGARMAGQTSSQSSFATPHITPDSAAGDPQLDLRWFIVETESDLQALGALIASYSHGHTTSEQLAAMASIAHKIKGAAPTVGLIAFRRVAIFLGYTLSAFLEGAQPTENFVEHTLGRFLVLCEACLAAAGAAEPPPANVVGQAQALYSSAARAVGVEPVEPVEPVESDERALPLMSVGSHAPATHSISEADVTLRVGPDRLDALMVHLSTLAMNRGMLAQAHARVTETFRGMDTTVDRLWRTSARINDAYPVGSSLTPRAPATDSASSERLLESSAARLQRLAEPVLGAQRHEDVDVALRALPEIVADVATHGATLASALMKLGQFVQAQESVVGDLQRDATQMRLAPLAEFAPSLNVFARVVADECSKRVRFTLSGEMTEIDRTLLRALIEPLRQLVRNAIIHGIEKPDERRAAGKDETGSVWVRARQAGSEVIIEVGDDGRGVDARALATRAVRMRRLREDEAATLPVDEVWRLMFAAGVTSLDQAGEMAGSGIGLAEVATLIRALNGDIAVTESSPRGTVFQIHAPMTLSAMQTIEVHIGTQAFAVPCSAVIVTLDGFGRLPTQEAAAPSRTPPAGGKPAVYLLPAAAVSAISHGAGGRLTTPRLADAPIPAYSLAECLGVASETPPDSAFAIERNGHLLALLVDRFGPMTETMVRPLPPFLRRTLIRGVTVRAEDGAIALLVDVAALADTLLDGSATAPPVAPSRAARARPSARVLIVDDSVSIRRALDQTLTRAGFATEQARDGIEALATMENEAPRVVILDVEMPRLGGFELLEIMRGSERYARTRVVMLTSRAGAIHERRAHELGADEYLIKPSSEDTIIATVRRLLNDSDTETA